MKNQINRKKRKLSYTLMEIAIVIAVIALLGTLTAPLYFRHLKKARQSTAKTQVMLLQQAILDFKIDTGKIPSSLDDLVKNPGVKGWDGPYLQGNLPKDPWGNDYVLLVPGKNSDFEVLCYGSDGQQGGSGEAEDISSWN
ncbi:MAG TPA: type II secretion system major pseudopilin GspG [Victivallales bacterium]|nr:type II secretion system major pseudopilin GspG [Victivallales bacterium]HRR06461.1 type II secretion system major pseudopilin GspG [Victivallales bacterium]HRR28942.1 type II secretion system major pseudopilin GspG [Victivallales bacterium]HRU00355.1 type II secretion system major pseudopilin GspG [Victivallales bacterium]